MKALNERAVKILLTLLAREQPLTDETNGKVRHIQAKMQTEIGKYRAIIFIFWEEDEFWRTKEPEITIFHDTVIDEYFPASIVYQTEQIVSNSASLIYGTLYILNEKMQTDHVEITENFLQSIAEKHSIE